MDSLDFSVFSLTLTSGPLPVEAELPFEVEGGTEAEGIGVIFVVVVMDEDFVNFKTVFSSSTFDTKSEEVADDDVVVVVCDGAVKSVNVGTTTTGDSDSGPEGSFTTPELDTTKDELESWSL